MELLIEFSNTSLRAILVLVILQMGKIGLNLCILGSKWYDDQRVAEVSTRSGRRKHTTHHVSPLPLSGGGSLADTPGFNQPSLLKVTKQSIAQTFPEVSISCTNSCNKYLVTNTLFFSG
ncbi:putative ribosome biogenesis GTPase RsgA [Medicago truncatula]|uniref:Putative ribosome biogenesis GTPase RsgA n=1 Tax=Medicago truncatula TaxID=3880 RepID=A0A396IXY3_MEDTR|nr:putative ribosome biogenesis GTPase RsgA [Medicago truncatula]